MYSPAAALALLAAAANAAVIITSPIATSNWSCDTREQVKWDDDKKSPSLAQMGMVEVDLYTGSATEQTFLAVLNTVNATDGVANVEIPCNVGPAGAFYFMRIHEAVASANRSDDAFSATFPLKATGRFNASVSSEVAAISSSSAAAASRSAASATSGALTASSTSPSATSDPTDPTTGAASLSRGISAGAFLLAGAAALLL